jgi:hypothetical protein
VTFWVWKKVIKAFVLGMHFSRPIKYATIYEIFGKNLTYVSIKIGRGDIQKCKTILKILERLTRMDQSMC